MHEEDLMDDPEMLMSDEEEELDPDTGLPLPKKPVVDGDEDGDDDDDAAADDDAI